MKIEVAVFDTCTVFTVFCLLRKRLREVTTLCFALGIVGLIDRSVTQSKTIAVEYSLTQLGRTIIDPLRGMCRWATRNRRRVSAEVRLLDVESG